MNIKDFDFKLPENLIAQSPLSDRSTSRLLVLNRQTKEVEHKQFLDILNYFKQGDCLVLNDTRVIPARLYGTKKDTGAKIEILLLHELSKDRWETLVKPAKRVQEGTRVIFGDGILTATCVEVKDHGSRVFTLEYEGILYNILDQLGSMPLPPYIKESLSEKDRYQTVYARNEGSAAAPTAGLHFTRELLAEIKSRGVELAYLTLHVGLGTFRPVNVENITEHVMHKEHYFLPKETADLLNQVKQNKGRIISVGTTTTRVLETVMQNNRGKFIEEQGWTDIFIYPPYEFKAIDGLVTNFHLPQSTLLMLVSALVDRETVLQTYKQAVEMEYRFFSFGDAMLILS